VNFIPLLLQRRLRFASETLVDRFPTPRMRQFLFSREGAKKRESREDERISFAPYFLLRAFA
jgi:hypothetical protein